ncbi:MAG TPA: TonB-dependent receptor [Caulobacteraceae bacterium]|jgi:outer membrane receptor protein involved in Fe transport
MPSFRTTARARLLSYAAAPAMAIALFATSAHAQGASTEFEIPAEPLAQALLQFSKQANVDVGAAADLTRGKTSHAVHGTMTPQEALKQLLEGTGLSVTPRGDGGLVVVRGETGPFAHGAEAPTSTVSEVVVTGTHIRGAPSISVNSETISRQEIDDSGYSTVEALVASIPQNFSDVSPEGILTTGQRPGSLSSLNSDYATAIDLRGLGPQSTLTLIDGQRVAGSDVGRAVDVSNIPLGIVDHVDILLDANSTIYGSDAVGGVANFVLKHQYDGVQTDAYYGGSDHGGYRVDANQILGKTYEHGGFVIAYDYAHETSFDQVKAGLTAPSVYDAIPLFQPLEPDTTRQTLYAAGQFEPTDSLKIYAEGSYAWKSLNEFVVDSAPAYGYDSTTTTDIKTSIYNAIVGADLALPASWAMKLSGSVSGNSILNNAAGAYTGSFIYNFQIRTKERSTQASGAANFDGPVPLFGLAGKAAFGGEIRSEAFNGANFTALPGLGITNANRMVESVYGEFFLPLFQDATFPGKLELSIGGRFDHYSDFGGNFSAQGGIRWEPATGFAIRASAGQAFRAPDFLELYQPVAEAIIPFDICSSGACQTLPTLDVANGNPHLKPETAVTKSIGIEINPARLNWLRLSMSYFDIDYKNRIENPIQANPPDASEYPDAIFLNPTAQQAQDYLNLIQPGALANYTGTSFDPGTQSLLSVFPNLAILDERYTNVALEHVDGIDFAAKARFVTDQGTYAFGFNGTLTLDHWAKDTPDVPKLSIIDEIGLPAAFRFRANAGWSKGPIDANVFVNYVGGYTNQFTTPESRMSSWTTVDLTLAVNGDKVLSAQVLKGWRAVLSVQNLFEAAPPYVAANQEGIIYDPANATGLGRYVSLRVSKRW